MIEVKVVECIVFSCLVAKSRLLISEAHVNGLTGSEMCLGGAVGAMWNFFRNHFRSNRTACVGMV